MLGLLILKYMKGETVKKALLRVITGVELVSIHGLSKVLNFTRF